MVRVEMQSAITYTGSGTYVPAQFVSHLLKVYDNNFLLCLVRKMVVCAMLERASAKHAHGRAAMRMYSLRQCQRSRNEFNVSIFFLNFALFILIQFQFATARHGARVQLAEENKNAHTRRTGQNIISKYHFCSSYANRIRNICDDDAALPALNRTHVRTAPQQKLEN